MHDDTAPDSSWGPRRRIGALGRAWRSAPESGRGGILEDRPRGGWVTDELVVRADFDRLRAHDLETGEIRWTWTVPGRDVLITASAAASGGIARVIHHEDGRAESVPQVAAVDLTTGESLWSHAYRGGLAWSDQRTAVNSRYIASVADDRVTAVGLERGERLWRTPLQGSGDSPHARILATDPLVVVREGAGPRGEQRAVVFDDSGEVTASTVLPTGYARFERPAVVVDGTLVAKLDHCDDDSRSDSRMGGFDLATGEPRWELRPGLDIDSLLVHRGRVLVLYYFGSKVDVLDARDGRLIARRRLRGDHPGLLCAAGDRIAVVGPSGRGTPLRVYRWR